MDVDGARTVWSYRYPKEHWKHLREAKVIDTVLWQAQSNEQLLSAAV